MHDSTIQKEPWCPFAWCDIKSTSQEWAPDFWKTQLVLLGCTVKNLTCRDSMAFRNSGSVPAEPWNPFKRSSTLKHIKLFIWMPPQVASQWSICFLWLQVHVSANNVLNAAFTVQTTMCRAEFSCGNRMRHLLFWDQQQWHVWDYDKDIWKSTIIGKGKNITQMPKVFIKWW